jgi:hypothetical protein
MIGESVVCGCRDSDIPSLVGMSSMFAGNIACATAKWAGAESDRGEAFASI